MSNLLQHGVNVNNLIVPVAVAALVVWIVIRQLTLRKVEFKPVIYIILLVLGLNQILQTMKSLHLTLGYVIAVGVGSILLPLVMGWLRAMTYHYSVGPSPEKDDQGLVVVRRQGNWLTVLLWVIYIIAQIGVGLLSPAAAAWETFHIGLSLLTQRYVAFKRAEKLYPEEMKVNKAHKK